MQVSGRFASRTSRVLAGVALASCAAICPVAAHAAPPTHGTVHRYTMPAPSVGDDARTVRVYLPPSYDTPAGEVRTYPVILLLHGWPGSDGNWFEMGHANETADSLIARGAIPEVILVCPNGAGAGTLGRSFWIDSHDGRKRVETYVTRDLITWVDEHFRTRRAASARGLIGLSEGGDAALNLALRHPDLFSACAGHSADYVLRKGFGTGGITGPEPGASRLLAENSPADEVSRLVERARRLTIYLDCGTEDESLDDTRAFHRQLDSLGVAHAYHEWPGSHTWGYWGRHLRDALLVIANALK